MHSTGRRLTAGVLCSSLMLLWFPASAWSATPVGGRIEGLLLDVEGLPAAGYHLVLVDPDGNATEAEAVSEEGLYSFRDLPAGTYSMAIQSRDGRFAPVAAAPVRLRSGQLVRRDVRMIEASPEQVDQAAANFGLRVWWIGLRKRDQILWSIGMIGFGVILWLLLTDDDKETVASPAL